MKTVILTSLILIRTVLHASMASFVALANYSPAVSPVSITVPAQYLAAEIRIECSEDDWELKLSGIENTRRSLVSAAEKEGWKARIDQALIWQTSYQKFSFSSSSGGQDALSDVLLLAPLSERTDLVQIVRQMRGIVSGLKAPRKVSVTLGSIRLAHENPEDYRSDLLKKIRVHVESSAKLLFDTPEYVISGLDGPVQVRQKGEREIEVFLPFHVTYAQKQKG